MKKNLKISKKTYETVFSFKIEGTMADPIIPTPPPPQPHPPPFPPLDPFPSGPGYPGYPGSPFPPLAPVGDYVGLMPWRQLVHVYVRDYSVKPASAQYDWIDGQEGIDWFNNWKQNHGLLPVDPETGIPDYDNPCQFSATIPGDRIVIETPLGMYPVGMMPDVDLIQKYAIIIACGYYCKEAFSLAEEGLTREIIQGIAGALMVSRSDNFYLKFEGDVVMA